MIGEVSDISAAEEIGLPRRRVRLGALPLRLELGRLYLGRVELGRIDPYWQRSRSWWIERSVREQVLLGALAAAMILAALLLLVIAPLQAERADALARIRVAALLEARLRAGSANVMPAARMRRGSASSIVTDSAAAARLTIERIEPEGGNTRVLIGNASFDQVLQWIADLEATSRLRVSQATIERKAIGVVSATLVIAG